MDINALIAALQGASTSSNINVNITVTPATPTADELPYTDFNVGDEVFVCHTKKDGTGTKHTWGTVIEVLGKDDKGWYTRVEGFNGKHYKTGLVYDEARLGSKIVNVAE